MSFDRDWYKNRNVVVNSRCFLDFRRNGALSSAISSSTFLINYPVSRVGFGAQDNSGTPATYNVSRRSGSNPLNALALDDTDGCARVRLESVSSGSAATTRLGRFFYSFEGQETAYIKSFPYTYCAVDISVPLAGVYSVVMRGYDGTNYNVWVHEYTVGAGEINTFKKIEFFITNEFLFRNSIGSASLTMFIPITQLSSGSTSTIGQWVSGNFVGSSNMNVDFFRSAAINDYAAIRNIRAVPCVNRVVPSTILYNTVDEDTEKCFRFGFPISSGNLNVAPQIELTTNYIIFGLPLVVPLARTPIFSGTEVTDWQVYSTSGAAQTGFALSVESFGNTMITLRATKTSHGLTSAQLFVKTINAYISADI